MMNGGKKTSSKEEKDDDVPPQTDLSCYDLPFGMSHLER